MSSLGSDANTRLPPVDERIVAPGSGFEIYDGKHVRVAPSHEPHGTCNARLAGLLGAHIAAEYDVAIDMLTRTSAIDDIAPDASVFPRRRDPVTGGRLLEELAFEVVATETLAHAGTKAAKLTGRGVRRVFAVDVERARVFEWSRELGTWSILDPRSHVTDAALAVPLPIAAVLAATTTDTVARALIANNNPVILEEKAQSFADGRREGQLEGRLEGLLLVLEIPHSNNAIACFVNAIQLASSVGSRTP
jgi:hypothetical protein